MGKSVKPPTTYQVAAISMSIDDGGAVSWLVTRTGTHKVDATTKWTTASEPAGSLNDALRAVLRKVKADELKLLKVLKKTQSRRWYERFFG